MKLHARNLLSVLSFDAASRLLGFGAAAYLARILGRDIFGSVSLALAVFSYGVAVANNGLNIIGTREVSRRGSVPLVADLTSVRFLLSAVAALVISVGAFFTIQNTLDRTLIVLFSLSLPVFAVQIDWYFQGKEDLFTVGMSKTLAGTAYLFLLLLVVHGPAAVALVPVAYLAGNAVNAIYLSNRYFASDHRRDSASTALLFRWRLLLKAAFPVGLGSVLSQLALNLPLIILGFFATASETGEYGAASKLIFFLLAMDRALYFLYYPFISRTLVSNENALAGHVQRSLKYVLTLALPLAAGGLLLAHEAVALIYGPGYDGAAVLVQILSAYFLATVLNTIFTYLLIAAGEERRYARVTVIGSLALMVCLAPLTLLWGGIGAASGMALAEALMAIAMYRSARRLFNFQAGFGSWRPVVCALIGIATFCSIHRYDLVPAIAGGLAAYGISLKLLRVVTVEDVRFVKERLL